MTGMSEIWALDGLWMLPLGVVAAGLVRGFSGFGTAMVYLPVAGQVLPPVWTLVTLIVIDLLGPIPAIPGALRAAHRRDVLRLGLGAALALPVGVWILTSLPPTPFRYAVSAVTLTLLILLVAGLRYSGPVGRPLIFATGGLSGLLGGAVGLPGPPVILLYMARPLPVAAIRASTLLFLVLFDAMLLAVFGVSGLLAPALLILGLILTLPYLAAVWLGTALFDPARETLYRRIAYAIILASALAGLPLFD